MASPQLSDVAKKSKEMSPATEAPQAPTPVAKEEDPNGFDLGEFLLRAGMTFAPALAGLAVGGAELGAKGVESGQKRVDKREEELKLHKAKKDAEKAKQAELAEIKRKEGVLSAEKALDRKTRMDIAGKQIAASQMQKQAINELKNVQLTQDLRKERNSLPITKATQDITQAYRRIDYGAKNDTPAGDVALIFNYMKMLDPGSVVREGEFNTAQKTGSIPDVVWAGFERVASGKRLSPAQRADFAKSSAGLVQQQLAAQAEADQQYVTIAERAGVDPSLVNVAFGQDIVMPGQAQKPGAPRPRGINLMQEATAAPAIDWNMLTDEELDQAAGARGIE